MSKLHDMLAGDAPMDDCVAQALLELRDMDLNGFNAWIRMIVLGNIPVARAREINVRLAHEDAFNEACGKLHRARAANAPVSMPPASLTKSVLIIPSCHLSDATLTRMRECKGQPQDLHPETEPTDGESAWILNTGDLNGINGWWLRPRAMLPGAPQDLLEVQAFLRRSGAFVALIQDRPGWYDDNNRSIVLEGLPVLSDAR